MLVMIQFRVYAPKFRAFFAGNGRIATRSDDSGSSLFQIREG